MPHRPTGDQRRSLPGSLAEDPADSETLELAAGRFGTAWHSARRAGNPVVEARAKAWFDRQRIPLPEPELAEEEDGG